MVRRRIAAVGLGVLGDADLDDLARVLTAERIAAAGEWSASTVRYQFAKGRDGDGQRFALERRELALAVVALALEEAAETSSRSVQDDYLPALADLAHGRTDAIVDALVANLQRSMPGASSEADGSARERALHLAIAVADTDAEAARLLRAGRARQVATYEPLFAGLLEATGRDLHPEYTVRDLVHGVQALIDGHLARMRFDRSISPRSIAPAVVAVFVGLTHPRGERPSTPAERLWPEGSTG